MTPEFIVAGWALSIIGSGVAAYVGVKIAIAQMQERLNGHDKELKDHVLRIERLEQPYFSKES